MEQHGRGIVNKNEERRLDLCGMNDLIIGGTLFLHRKIHNDMVLPKWKTLESDRPYNDQRQVDEIASRCQSEERC